MFLWIIGEKMHQILASLENAAPSMKSFALDAQDKNAKQMFSQYAQQLDSICQGIQNLCNYIEKEEPQYKVF